MEEDLSNNRIQYEDDQLNYKKYFYLILANWYWFVLSIFIGLGIAWFVNRYTKPMYRVTGSIIIQESANRGLENLIPGIEIYRTQKLVLNELEVLKSHSLARRTLDQLNFDITYVGVGRSGIKESVLYRAAPFYVVPDSIKRNLNNYKIYIDILSKTHYRLRIDDQYRIEEKLAFGEKLESELFNFTIHLKDPENFDPDDTYNTFYFVFNSPVSLSESYRSRLNIRTNDERRGSVLYLSLSGNNPYQITDYLNKLMFVYITKGLEEKNQTAINTVNFIDEQLAILDTSLRNAEFTLQDFMQRNRLIDLGSEGSAVFSRLEGLLKEKAMLELQNRYFDYLKEYIADRNNMNQVVVPATLDISDPLLGELIRQLNEVLTEKVELAYTAKQGSPNMDIVESKIETIRSALFDNIQSLLNGINIKRDELEKQIEVNEKQLSKYPVTERLLISIQRQYKVNDQIYTYLLQKRAESAVAKAANVSDNKILDPARSESAVLISPKRKSNNIMGLALGTLIPFLIIILIEMTNNKISSRSDIESKTRIPIISSIGHSGTEGDVPVFDNPKSALAESFRGLRTNLQYLLREKEQKLIVVSSALSGEGKTFCSINLAVIYAMAGKKTLLMGFDLRKPKIHKIFNLDNSKGISTCLIGQTKLEDIIQPTQISNLYVAPAGPTPPNPAELIDHPDTEKFFREARSGYDIIVLDTPPFGMVTDALLIARYADLNLFILRQNFSTRDILEMMEDLYSRKKIGSIGLVINDIKRKGYYGYGYRYYNYDYSSHYGYYYTYENYLEEGEG